MNSESWTGRRNNGNQNVLLIVAAIPCVTNLPADVPTIVPTVVEPLVPLGLVKGPEKLLVLLPVMANVPR